MWSKLVQSNLIQSNLIYVCRSMCVPETYHVDSPWFLCGPSSHVTAKSITLGSAARGGSPFIWNQPTTIHIILRSYSESCLQIVCCSAKNSRSKNQKQIINMKYLLLRFSNQQLTNDWKTTSIVLLSAAAPSSRSNERRNNHKKSVEKSTPWSWRSEHVFISSPSSIDLM